MKITQEVRDFAASAAQQGAAVRGTDAVSGSGICGEVEPREAVDFIASDDASEAEEGMVKMAAKFRKKGSVLYFGASDREQYRNSTLPFSLWTRI